MQTYRIGFFVEIEVDAHDSTEAALVAERAAGWPGDWSPPHGRVHVTGVLSGKTALSGKTVHANIIRSRVLMVKETEE
jgi:hypothetical protein